MPKKITTTKTLVIVESPAKCKKIEEYLGPGYKCIASYGHLREISSLKHIDIEKQFEPTYTVIDNPLKKKQIEIIRKEIKKADHVVLALDGDREGEKIAYCIAQLFHLDIEKTMRIVFHEITESAIQYAIKHPRTIDMNLVYAQQARQILDILVGFKISPMLWKCIARNKDSSLSAGRCQTPALRLVYDNYQEIHSSQERKVYHTVGHFTNSNIPFELNVAFETKEKMVDFLEGSIDFTHIYTCTKPVKKWKPPPEPFTTSRLLQVASNELHYSPKETMRLCQVLYEAGYITYMRTDSKTYSGDFIHAVKEYLSRTYNESYIHKDIDTLISENKGEKGNTKKRETKETNSLSQEAHEAIRPTQISLDQLPETMDNKEKKMYKLIWENTVESCMSAASFQSITAKISAYQNTTFAFTSELIDFPGWKRVKKKYTTDNKEFHYLQIIKQDAPIHYNKMYAKVGMKGSKPHYTEARLVQLLEEKGIGRPSTFSSLVEKIQERKYVVKEDILGKEIVCQEFELEKGEIFEIETKREFGNEKGKLVIQPLGILVMEFIDAHFLELFTYDYTREMEEELDKIAKNQGIWYELCKTCNTQLDHLIDGLKEETKIEFSLDDNHTYLIGKYGPVIKCVEKKDGKEEVTFKPIKKDMDIHKLKKGDYTVEDLVDTTKHTKTQYILGQYNGKEVVLKKGKFGLYLSWDKLSKTMKEFGNRPMENIRLEEVIHYLEEGSNVLREISNYLSIRKGTKGEYLFYKNGKMKKPQFYDIKGFAQETKKDYKTCDATVLKSWIQEKYNIE
jgi:DNA topoisomerase-1